jgi:very-short-patch-repair endonuclease
MLPPLAGGSEREGVMKQAAEHMAFARQLRHSATDAERALWAKLRNRQLDGLKFRRQCPLGPYTVDFVCFERQLVIEVDGGHHTAAAAQNALRTRWLRERGYTVLRFWNNEVLGNMAGVLTRISESLGLHPHPGSLPSRERGRSDEILLGIEHGENYH